MIGRLFARIPEAPLRALGLLFFAGVAVWRAFGFFDLRQLLQGVVVWRPWGFLLPATEQFRPYVIAESIAYVLLAVGYVRRAPAIERASTWPEILLPPVGGLLPFAFGLSPWGADRRLETPLEIWSVVLPILGGDLLMAVSYAFLGGSFSILVDARPLKDRGPYRLVRHPVYVGTLLVTLGVTIARFSASEVALWVSFLVVQVTRAVLEERKLARATPGYAEYRERTWMFIPFVV